jgi:hypothetical protein
MPIPKFLRCLLCCCGPGEDEDKPLLTRGEKENWENFFRERVAQNTGHLNAFNVVDAQRPQPQYNTSRDGRAFTINRGHAYLDHATGPKTNPRFSGPPEPVEFAIMDDVNRRLAAGGLPPVTRIALPGTAVLFRHVPIRYNAVTLRDSSVVISDYMVWQGQISDLTF